MIQIIRGILNHYHYLCFLFQYYIWEYYNIKEYWKRIKWYGINQYEFYGRNIPMKKIVAGPGQCEDSDDNKLNGLLKLFIYGGISFFIVVLQRTSLSKAIRNVLEQTITRNIMLIQKIIDIDIKVKVKNEDGVEQEIDINEFEKNRNISDYSYGEEIRKKLEKINTINISKNSKLEDLSVKDCENISKLKVIYNNLKTIRTL